eukprot:jgi/Ulvmu1/1506/UM011_0236.1
MPSIGARSECQNHIHPPHNLIRGSLFASVDASLCAHTGGLATRAQAAWYFLAGKQQMQRRGCEIQELETAAAHSVQQAELRLMRAAMDSFAGEMRWATSTACVLSGSGSSKKSLR